jgi:hypothetical protein
VLFQLSYSPVEPQVMRLLRELSSRRQVSLLTDQG